MAATPGVLIGRRSALDRATEQIERVAAGASAVTVLTGLPGVGKTALAKALLAVAEAAGFITFSGAARPLSAAVAYAPLVEALGPALQRFVAARPSAETRALAPLALLTTGADLSAPAPLGDPALERSRLTGAFVLLIERLAGTRPAAILVDDVDICDDATAATLTRLVSGTPPHPLLLVLTAREESRDRADEIASVAARSEWIVDRQMLAPFDDDDAGTLVRAVLGDEADPDLVTAVVAQCGGRALLLDAAARTVAEHQASGIGVPRLPVPDDVRLLLHSRLQPCSDDERAVLELLAVAADALAADTVIAALGLDSSAVVEALDRLQRRGLVQSADGLFDVAHGLLREVVAADQSAIAAQRTHARLVRALGTTHPDDPRAALHAWQAGPLLDPAHAFELLSRGGMRSRELGMNSAAAQYLSAAVELCATHGDAGRRGELLSALADIYRRLGRPDDAERTWERARRDYLAAAHPEGVAHVEQELGMLWWNRGDLAAGNEHFARAEQALAGLEPSSAHAELLYTRTVTASRTGDAGAVIHTARELRRLAQELDSPSLEARAYLAEAVLDYATSDYRAMIDKCGHALRAAERAEAPLLVIRAHDQMAVAAASQLDVPMLQEHSRASLQCAQSLGSPILEGWPRARLSVAALLCGQWDEALRASSELVEVPRRYGEHRGAVSTAAGHAWVLVHRGRLADARRLLAEARVSAAPMLQEDRNIFSIVAIAECQLGLASGRPAEAAEQCGQLGDITGGWLPLLGLALLGEARALSGDHDGALEIGSRLAAIRSVTTVAPTTLSAWVAGLVAAQTGGADAVDRLVASHTGFETLGLPFLAARALLTAAEVLATTARSRQHEAIDWAQQALAVFDSLDAPIEAQRSRRLLRELGTTPSRGRAAKATVGPLSRRELEVARTVAAGLTNAEVARALFISPRTVTTHLEHIYARLGLGSRAALTRYLADSGLLDEPDGGTPSPLAMPQPSNT